MRSDFAMRVLAVLGLSVAALWGALPAAAQNIVVVLDPATDLEDEDFAGVDEFEGDLFEVVDTLADAFTVLRDNPAIGEMWLVRKDDCGVWNELFPTLGGDEDDAVNALVVRGFPFDEPWRVIVQGGSGEAAINIVSTPATDILIEGITVSGGDPAVLITTPDEAEAAGSVILDRCIIRDAASDGVEVAGVADARIYNTAIYQSGGDGVYAAPGATVELEYVSILGNSGAGLYADGSADFDDPAAFTLNPTDDAYIDEDFPGSNFGLEPELLVREGSDGQQLLRTEAVLTFENPGLEDVDSIVEATLVLHDTRDVGDTADLGITAVFGTDPAGVALPCASCITWDNAPAVIGMLDAQIYSISGGSFSFNVTQAFEDICGTGPCSLDERVTVRVWHLLTNDSPQDGLTPAFASSDNGDASLHPLINLQYIDDNGDSVTLVIPVDTNSPGPEDDPVDCGCTAEPAQDFPGDTTISQQQPATPTGEEADPTFALVAGIEDEPGQRSALLQFLIEDLEPGKAISAELRLVVTEMPAGTTLSLFGAADPRPPLDTLAVDGGFWSEEDIGWDDDNEPTAVRPLDTFTFATGIEPGDPPQLITFDVTEWVQGNGAVSFRIESDSDEDGQVIVSKEGDSPPELFFVWQEDLDPFDEEDEPTVRINNSLMWANGDGAFFEVKPGTIQQGGGAWNEEEPEDTSTMHIDDLGEIFDREPGVTASNPQVVLSSAACSANFPGRITSDESPLIERGDGLPAGFNLDIDFDVRPGTGADIGADQLESAAVGPVTWFYSAVTPPPGCFDQQGVIGDPVGEIDAGQLRVEVRTRSAVPGVSAMPDAVFILPQDHMRRLDPSRGGGPLTATFEGGQLDVIIGAAIEDPEAATTPLEVIRLNRQASTSGATSVWIGTNASDISTRLLPGPGNTGGFAAGDTFADGHAVVMLAYAEDSEVFGADPRFNVVGDEGALNAGITTLDEEGAIIDQALVGRHVLIDTIPPRFNFEEFGQNPTASRFYGGSNDQLLPSNLPGDTHPFGGPPATSACIVGVWPTAVDLVPSDSGALSDSSFAPPRSGPGGSLFFNHASIANRSGLEPTEAGGIEGTFSTVDPVLNALRARMQVLFTDVTVEEYYDIVHTADTEPFNPFTNSSVRPIAGFRETLLVPFGVTFPTTVEDLLDETSDDLFPLLWEYGPNSRRFLEEAAVEVTYGVEGRDAVDSQGALGSVLDFEAIRAGEFDTSSVHPNSAIAGDWHFVNPDGSGSITFEDHIRNNHFVARLLFQGRDAACNVTPTALDERNMGPLNLWWMVDTDTRMTRHTDLDQLELGEASFDWELARGYSPRAIGQPQPLFTWRIYGATTNNPDGPYEPISGWFPWCQDRSARPMVTAQEFEDIVSANPPAFLGRWLMIVAIGADEAGNVTKWPFQDWAGNPDAVITPIPGSRERANWLRVRIEREQRAQASLAGQFWWQPWGSLFSPPLPLDVITPLQMAEWARRVPKRPPEGGEVYRSVVPMPPVTAPLTIYAKFSVELSGITADNLGPNDSLNVLFDLKRQGSAASLVSTGDSLPGYGVRIEVPRQTRRLDFYLPLSGGRGIAIAPEVFTGSFDPATGGQIPFAAAFEFEDDRPFFLEDDDRPALGDHTRQRSVEYIARSTVWIIEAGAATTLPADDRSLQAKPSNIRFTVVPDATRTQFFRPRYSPDDQPIRVREQQ